MNNLFQDLSGYFSNGEYMPHGQCYLWQPGLLWTHFLSDLLIGIAYVGIAVLLYRLVKRIKLPFSGMFLAFGAFIAFCGLTHFMAIWNIWDSAYWTSAGVKGVTAVASIAVWAFLFPTGPKVIEMANAAKLSEERKLKLEEAHREVSTLYEQIKETDELKTQFFANVSHELRTPLALLLGPAEKLAHDPGLDGEQRRQAGILLRNARLLLKQVNDLLDLSKLEAGRLKPDYIETDLAKLLKVTVAHFESAMQTRDIALTMDTPELMPAQVDAEKIQRVFMNLISNAVKFSPDGGKIQVLARREGDKAVFTVSDTGRGIDPEHQELIFERFRQSHGGINREYGGTGLGLAIAKDFVEMHGGAIRLLDDAGPGATFQVTLPLSAPAGAEVSEADSPTAENVILQGAVEELSLQRQAPESVAARPGKPTLLVCEDNPDMNNFIAETLADEFNVISARDGSDGLNKAQAAVPDLIISDIMMPRMGGDELLRQTRQHTELRRVPVLLLSARADDELRIHLLKEGASDYLVKPFEPEELLARAGNLVALKLTRDVLESELESKSDDLVALANEVVARGHEASAARASAESARVQAEESSQVKGAFLTLASHELNTPLTSLHLNLEMLKRRHDKESDRHAEDDQGKMLERALSSSRHLKQLVEALLEYSRVESGRLLVENQDFDMAAALRENLEELETLAAGKGLELTTEVAEGACTLRSDPRLVRVVLNNLVSNAVKFTSRGRIEVHCQREGDDLRVEVRDTGLGIAPEDQERIFNPFEQLEPLARKSSAGVGLGLALVKQIVDALDGRISLESTPGEGSVFTVFLPVRPSGEEAP